MKAFATATAIALATAVLAGPAAAQSPTEIRILWYADGNEGEVLQDLIARFEADNPDIDVVIDQVSYRAIQETLPVQLESGQGPDLARVTDLQGQAEHWLDLRPYVADGAYWDANFGPFLDWMRPAGSDAIPGFMTQLTITGPFVNRTLFEQAGVDLPEAGATWDDWAAAVRQVAEVTQVPIPLAMDRSGHRFAGPAISYGAGFIGTDGEPAVVDDGFRAMARRIADWHEDGTMATELWGSVSGTTYLGANEEFANSQVVMYMSGSWQIGQFDEQIGTVFDWWAVPNPCGDAACSGMPGGAGLVAVRYTEHPEEVGRVMDFLASEDALREFHERTLFIPAHAGLATAGLDFQSDNPLVVHALDVFSTQVPDLAQTAIDLQAYEWSRVIFGAVISRLGQVVAGELPLDDALTRIENDIANQLREADRG